jgi:translocation and assembly module TamB
MKRFLLIAVLVLVLLIVGGFLYLRHYVQSPEVAQQLTQRLQEMYGGPVRVESVDVGLGGSTLSGFELFEPGSDGDRSTPWLTVGSISTDISLWDILRGQAMPRHVTLKQVKVTLRFDVDGHLVTQFPPRAGSALDIAKLRDAPEVSLEQGEVVLHRQGLPELAARNVTARLSRGEDGKIVLSGTGESDALGKLILNGSLATESEEAVVTLKTNGKVHVTQAVLNRLPFIPAITWQELQIAEGYTAAELTVRYKLQGDTPHWHLTLAPEQTALRIAVLDLAAHGATGAIVVKDYRIELRNVHGKAYGGEVQLDADLDFSGDGSKLHFPKITLTNLDVNAVPESWNNAELEAVRRLAPKGRLTGTASVDVTMSPGKLAPAAVEGLFGLAASPRGFAGWLPAVAALAAFPPREVQVQSTGKATITGVAGGTAEIELRLGPQQARPNAPAKPQSSGVWIPKGLSGSPLFAANTLLLQGPAGPEVYPEINARLGQAVGKLLGGVQTMLRDVVGFGGAVVAGLPKKVEPSVPVTPDTPTTYLDVNLKLKDVELAHFVKGLGTKLDIPVQGKMSVEVKLSIPTNRAGDLKEYKAAGSAQVRQLVLAGVKVAALDADIRYHGGVLELTRLAGNFAGPEQGSLQGKGRLPVVPLGELAADLTLDRIPIGELAGLARSTVPIGGTLSGQLALRAPASKLKDAAVLEGGGKLTADRITVHALTLEGASTSIDLKGGVLRLPDLKAKLEGTPITASAQLRLGGDFPFKGTANLKNWDLSALHKLAAKGTELPVQLAGSFTTSVDVRGTLNPLKASISGDAATAGLSIDALQVSTIRFHWTTSGKTFDLSNIDLRLYGGQASGSAVLPLDPAAAGNVNLKLEKLDAKQLVKDLDLPVKIEGEIGGVVKGTMPPAPAGEVRTAMMELDVTAPKLRVQNIPTEGLHGKLDYKNGIVDYKLEGKTLGGTFELDGQVPAGVPVKKESKKGKLRIENVSLLRLAEVLGLRDGAPITGRLSIALDFTHDLPDRVPEGRGNLRLDNARWHGTALAASLTADLVLAKGVLQLRELTGDIAQGTARIQVAFDVHNPERSRFALVLENVEAAQLLAPWTGDRIKGTIQARIGGTPGSSWHGNANLELTRGEVYGMEVTQWRLPADWHYSPATGRAQVDVYETSAQVARGRMLGKMSAVWDYGLRIDGNARFFGVDLQTLIRPFFGSTNVAAGQVTGQFTFSGSEVRSINDISGNLVAAFTRAQALQMPVLRQITPYIGMGPTTTFQRGDLRGRLDRGVLRIQQLALEGGNLKLHVDGTVGLEGRLGLHMVAKTGDVGLPTVRLAAIGLRIPIAGPVPITMLQEVSSLLANRAIYLEVAGTVRSPVIRVRPMPMLSEEAVRFFLNRTNLPIPLAP